MSKQVFVAFGGNLGDVKQTLKMALGAIKAIKGVFEFKVSALYQTTPVSNLPQPHFINGVCCFKTKLTAHDLFNELEAIESSLGKVAKEKSEPRKVDLDLLFYGNTAIYSPRLTVPHPRWKERLFVLKPLSDLTDEVIDKGQKIRLKAYIETFSNPNKEEVVRL